jgi:cytochrome d ubiquinol oxidase subunit II
VAFGVGSLIAAVCQGFVLGGLIAGPQVREGQFVGRAFGWLSPFSLLTALGVVFGYVLLGATYLIMKTTGEQQRQAVQTAWITGALMLIVAAGVSVWTPIRYSFVAEKWFGGRIDFRFVVPPAFALFCSVMLARSLWNVHDHAPFFWTIGIFVASLAGLAGSLSPYLVPRTVTALEAGSDSLTLVFMMLGIGILIPVMIAYNAYQYAVFRGKVTGSHYG